MFNSLKHTIFVLNALILTYRMVFSAICTSGDTVGRDPSANANSYGTDANAGTAHLMTDVANVNGNTDFTFTCCGYIDQWQYLTKGDTGTINFQVWRETGAVWTLVGENVYSHTDGTSTSYSEDITTNQILVQNGDVIGIYFPGNKVIAYKGGSQSTETSAYSGTSTYNWDSESSLNRDFGVRARLVSASAPTIDNLDAVVGFTDDTAVGTVIFTLTVSDADLGVTANEILTTTLTSSNGTTYFEFSGTSLNVTTKYKLASGTYIMTFQVADSCGETDTGTLTIEVSNFVPVINNLPASVEISEDQSYELFLYTVDVTDSEAVTCTVTSPAGVPFLTKNGKDIYFSPSGSWPYLDYSTTPQYDLTIECTDTKDPVSALFTVNLTENVPPTIHNLPSHTSIVEDQILDQLIYALSITDPTNDRITCDITSPATSPFYTKPVTPGTSDYGIYVQYNPGLDFNTQSQYDLTVSCGDLRTNVTGTFTVQITENQPPVFTNLDNSTSISTLTTNIGYQVFRVFATDNENDTLFFNMTCDQSSCPLQITNSGDVLATSTLYGTTVSTYNLQIYVYDTHMLVGPKTLTIYITDINNQPSFTTFPVTVVNENSALGSSVYQVTYSDPDVGDIHTFTASFHPAKGASYFKVDVNTGLVSISSTNTIDYEALTDKVYNVNISVFDGHTFTTETLVIWIADVNEAPKFDKSFYLVTGDEGIANGPLTDPNIKVSDPDSGDTMYYTMDCGTYQGLFIMDSGTGNVTFGPAYDLDTGTYPSSLICNITVSDGSLTDNAGLQIFINEVNDNLPQFSAPTYSFYTAAEDGIGTSIGTVNATDGDSGSYGILTYSLNQSSSSCECFGITGNGNIYVTGSLSNFTNGEQVTMVAKIIDGGNRQDTATVIVYITPVVTTASTTTTDRYRTFSEDPRNSIWLVLVGSALLGLLILLGYYTYSFGWLDPLFRQCANRVRKPVQKPERPPPPPSPSPPPQRYHNRVNTEINELPSVGELSWEPWKTEDFLKSQLN